MKQVVCGVDVGSWTFKVCIYDWKTFQILTNEANFRETPSLVSYTNSHRLIGEQASNKIKSNYANTIRAPLRLIGLQRDEQLVEEELKGCTAKYQVESDLTFLLGPKRTRVTPEELLAGLLGKVWQILAQHQMTAELIYLSVPSYLSQHQRRIIKRCAQLSGGAKEARIIDDWVSICSEYSFTRVKELSSGGPRVVVFIDVGYSKTSLFVVEFGNAESRLLDCEHMRFVGARNLDHLLAQFYDVQFKRLNGTSESLFSMPRALVKLNDHIQKQRRVLSANSEHHLHAQALVQDNDLSYTLTRAEMETVVVSALDLMRKGFSTLRQRMPQHIRIHSVELLGGASRIPAVRNLALEVFGLEPSKTLNQSQAMAHGTAVFGAKDAGLFYYDYSVVNVNLVEVMACWNYSGSGNFLGEQQTQYKHRQVLFGVNCKLPGENVLSFGNQGPIEMYIHYAQNISRRSIGYVRFNTPNRIRFLLDNSKIVSAQLDIGSFSVRRFYQGKEEKWMELRIREQDRIKHEERLRRIHELKNLYEAKLYAFKERVQAYRDVMNEPEAEQLDIEIRTIQEWIESEHSRELGSQLDIHLYTSKIQQITAPPLLDALETRKRNISVILQRYQLVKTAAEEALSYAKNGVQSRRLNFLLQWLFESYEGMKRSKWEGYYLTEASLDFALAEVGRIRLM